MLLQPSACSGDFQNQQVDSQLLKTTDSNHSFTCISCRQTYCVFHRSCCTTIPISSFDISLNVFGDFCLFLFVSRDSITANGAICPEKRVAIDK